jgi:hypothetical protein
MRGREHHAHTCDQQLHTSAKTDNSDDQKLNSKREHHGLDAQLKGGTAHANHCAIATAPKAQNPNRRSKHPLSNTEWQILTNEIDMLLKPTQDCNGQLQPPVFNHDMRLITRLLAAPTGFSLLTRMGPMLANAEVSTGQLSLTKFISDIARLNGHDEPHNLKRVCKQLSAERDIIYLQQFHRCDTWRLPDNGSTRPFNVPIYGSPNGHTHISLANFSEELCWLQHRILVTTEDSDNSIVTRVVHHAQSQLGISFSGREIQILYQSVKEPAASEAFWRRVHGSDNPIVYKQFVRDSTYALCRLGVFLCIITWQSNRPLSPTQNADAARTIHTKLSLSTREGGEQAQAHPAQQHGSPATGTAQSNSSAPEEQGTARSNSSAPEEHSCHRTMRREDQPDTTLGHGARSVDTHAETAVETPNADLCCLEEYMRTLAEVQDVLEEHTDATGTGASELRADEHSASSHCTPATRHSTEPGSS